MDNTKFNFDELEKFIRKDIMPVNLVSEISKPSIKIDKVEDYYNFFVSMLRTEDSRLHNKEHLWILGIDKNGYSTCAYLINYTNKMHFNYDTDELLSASVMYHCKKIILAYYKNTGEK